MNEQMEQRKVTVIGGGLAGVEAAWQAAKRGLAVDLYEMRPQMTTPAHQTGHLAELVCSNSLRAANIENAVGLLKEEMRQLDSLVMAAADATRIPAGGALAVDRVGFSAYIEAHIMAQPNIRLLREEVREIPGGLTIIAAGPLASPALSAAIQRLTGQAGLFFHDAVAPVVAKDSVNMDIAFFASRYDKGAEGEGGAYLNCPMNKEQYLEFYQALITAERHPLKDFEAEIAFEGCMPIETMAGRGLDTIRYGPLKPVGLVLPGGGEAYAVVQLRQDDAAATLYNMVGFQTRLKWGEQKRVFSMIPGLEQAEFIRYGQMHRNTYLNSPELLNADLTLRARHDLLFAGQITGVEGYVESAAAGLVAGINAARIAHAQQTVVFPRETALGSLLAYIATPNSRFQPMNIIFGLFPPLEHRERNKKLKNQALAKRALEALGRFQEQMHI